MEGKAPQPLQTVAAESETELWQATLDMLLTDFGGQGGRQTRRASMSTSDGLSLFGCPLCSPQIFQVFALEPEPKEHGEMSGIGSNADLDDDGSYEVPITHTHTHTRRASRKKNATSS
eukprot:TRINITY_DN27912_c0_g1_i3.p1 TRINITY_DN27912_c0_g1~~TRINITY_DN27912_c0_g1_i3.p1  ORF type:complete len:131 (-),score=22.51 TRINITY_DN27912_c0_g1_i3:73-426(-)